MTYLDNEILTNAKHIHMAFRELVGHNTSRKLTMIVFIVSMNSLAHMMHFAVE